MGLAVPDHREGLKFTKTTAEARDFCKCLFTIPVGPVAGGPMEEHAHKAFQIAGTLLDRARAIRERIEGIVVRQALDGRGPLGNASKAVDIDPEGSCQGLSQFAKEIRIARLAGHKTFEDEVW